MTRPDKVLRGVTSLDDALRMFAAQECPKRLNHIALRGTCTVCGWNRPAEKAS